MAGMEDPGQLRKEPGDLMSSTKRMLRWHRIHNGADPDVLERMMEIEAMIDAEVIAEIDAWDPVFGEVDRVRLESALQLRAAVLGWTGDPLKQPPRTVLAAIRRIKGSRT